MSVVRNLNSLLEEAQQMLVRVAEVLTSTMQQGVEAVKNYEELASDKVSEITKTEKKKLADSISGYGQAMKSCSEKGQTEFEKVEKNLRNELAVCYKKHYGSIDKITIDKSAIHAEAERLKNDIEKAVIECTASPGNKIESLVREFKNLKKRIEQISSRMNDNLKKETTARKNAAKAVYECDKKAYEKAQKKCSRILEDFKRCADKDK